MTRRKRKDKALRVHSRRRAYERYGIELGPASRKAIVGAIQGGLSRPVERQSLRVTVHDVEFDGGVVRVVYDSRRKELVTFLPTPESDIHRLAPHGQSDR